MPTNRSPNHDSTGVAIGERVIGRGRPALVIAEAGVNHNGCVETALSLVDAAADAGADAVKFQWFHADDLVTAGAPKAGYQQASNTGSTQREMLRGLELPRSAFELIQARCEAREVLFLVTPFGVEEVRHLIDMGVRAIKIASTDVSNGPLLDAVGTTGLPMLLSTGASTPEEITATVAKLKRTGADDRLILLHCVSAYPTPLDAANLRAIESLERLFDRPCGLSDHTTSTDTGGWAVAAGACVLEKHFTLDRAAPGPDHAMSLTPDRLATYIKLVRDAERALGNGRIGLTELERDVRSAAARSVVASVDIAMGTPLTPSMFALKRPGTGIPPADLDRLGGRRAAVDIPCDTVLSWDMVE